MPFQWTEFIEVAKKLQSQYPNGEYPEGCFRSAVSRFYYGAYGHTRCYLSRKGLFIPTRTHEDHTELRKALLRQSRTHLIKAAGRLETLYEWRNQCDYDDNLPNQKELAEQTELFASFVINQIDNDEILMTAHHQ